MIILPIFHIFVHPAKSCHALLVQYKLHKNLNVKEYFNKIRGSKLKFGNSYLENFYLR
jgi:hypothetical protein